MDSFDLTSEQARQIHEALLPASCYLRKLQERMVACGFKPDDELRVRAEDAYSAMRSLRGRLMYMASGTDRRTPKSER